MSVTSVVSTPSVRRLLALPAVAAVLLLSGCGGSSSTGGTALPAASSAGSSSAGASSESAAPASDSASAPAGSSAPAVQVPACATNVSDAAEGFATKLPCGYTRITSKAQLDAIMKKGLSEVKGTVNVTPAQLQQAKLFAVNPKTGSSINLIVTPAGGMTGKDLSSQQSAIKQQLEGIGAQGLAFTDITVAGDTALRAKATMVTKSAKLQMVQVYAVHSDKAYIFTFTGLKALTQEEQLVLGTLTLT